MEIIDASEYFEHPIFLHVLNRELHDAIGKPVDIAGILSAIRVFSVVSAQTVFCNVSQIHEVLYNCPDVLREIVELSKIGRFIDHSDYGSFEEFRESRAEKFSHSVNQHPGFFLEPLPELKKLPHGSMGESVSTTGHIENNLRLWLEGDRSSALQRTLSQDDAGILRANENWIDRTLNNRDQKALTFDVFEQASEGPIERRAEGSIRRSLTEIYIDSYVTSFDARCIWGFRGKNHFERTKLLAGLNFPFATMVLEQVGISDNLKKSADFGRVKRITSDNQDAAAYFRQGYAELATSIDDGIADPYKWHLCSSRLTSATQRLLSTGALKPQRPSHSYRDILLRGGDLLKQAAKAISDSRPANSQPAFPSAWPQTPAASPQPKTPPTVLQPASKHGMSRGGSLLNNHAVLVVLGALLMGLGTYIILPEFFELTARTTWLFVIVATLIGGAIVFWYHPDNFNRRMAFVGLAISIVGGASYRLEFEGWFGFGDGNFEIGNLPSTALVIGGLLYSALNIIIDAISRWKRDEHE